MVNIAHRGASAYAPEHTLAAYRLAIEMGADYVEQDLQLTRDGVLVCLHDPTLQRTTNVANVFPDRCTEIEERGRKQRVWPVSDFSLAEIKCLDAGSWFGADFAGAQVPTLQEALDLIKGHAGIYPETKAPEEYGSRGLDMERELLEILAANGLDSARGQRATPAYIQSFSPDSLGTLRSLAGSIYRLIQLVDRAHAPALMSDRGLASVAEYATGVGPALSIVVEDPSRTPTARRLGLEVHPYTVRAAGVPERFSDASSYMRFLRDELGVTGIFTDNPDLFPR